MHVIWMETEITSTPGFCVVGSCLKAETFLGLGLAYYSVEESTLQEVLLYLTGCLFFPSKFIWLSSAFSFPPPLYYISPSLFLNPCFYPAPAISFHPCSTTLWLLPGLLSHLLVQPTVPVVFFDDATPCCWVHLKPASLCSPDRSALPHLPSLVVATAPQKALPIMPCVTVSPSCRKQGSFLYPWPTLINNYALPFWTAILSLLRLHSPC